MRPSLNYGSKQSENDLTPLQCRKSLLIVQTWRTSSVFKHKFKFGACSYCSQRSVIIADVSSRASTPDINIYLQVVPQGELICLSLSFKTLGDVCTHSKNIRCWSLSTETHNPAKSSFQLREWLVKTCISSQQCISSTVEYVIKIATLGARLVTYVWNCGHK